MKKLILKILFKKELNHIYQKKEEARLISMNPGASSIYQGIHIGINSVLTTFKLF